MRLILYGFKICPFVERVKILINEKQISVEQVAIDIRNKPAWFSELSPAGKVPALRVDDLWLFESAVINDFLDSLSGQASLYPTDVLLKHHNKSWIEFGSTLIMDTYHMTFAKDSTVFQEKKNVVERSLHLLQNQLNNYPFFNGERFSMIDLTYAPFFKRLTCLHKFCSINLLQPYPKLQAWSNTILDWASVQQSFVSNFEEEFKFLFSLKGGFLSATELLKAELLKAEP